MDSHSSQRVVDAARSWIGTRFLHQGRRKKNGNDKGGVDCLGLLVGVADECSLMQQGKPLAGFDERDYGHYPCEKRLLDGLLKHFERCDKADMRAGDVVLVRIDEQAQHVGIIGDYAEDDFSLIHAYAPARAVVEHRLDADWMRKVVCVLRLTN